MKRTLIIIAIILVLGVSIGFVGLVMNREQPSETPASTIISELKSEPKSEPELISEQDNIETMRKELWRPKGGPQITRPHNAQERKLVEEYFPKESI